MTTEPFVLATNVEHKDPLELDLHNLKLRLEILQRWVDETEAQIRSIEERLQS